MHAKEEYQTDPQYQAVLFVYQRGEWHKALAQLDELIAKHPNVQHLDEFKTELQHKAVMEREERKEHYQILFSKLRRIFIQVLIVVAIVAAGYYLYQTYAAWLRDQVSLAEKQVTGQFQKLELAANFRNAQDLFLSGRLDEARESFLAIKELDPDYPNVDAYLQQIAEKSTIEEKYKFAIELIKKKDFDQALILLKSVEETAPFYRDVPLKIEEIEQQFYLESLYDAALEAYYQEDWGNAIARFESIRALFPDYQNDAVKDFLFVAYVSQADQILIGNEMNSTALTEADGLYRKALALRPQDPDVIRARSNARQRLLATQYAYWVDRANIILATSPDNLEDLQRAEGYYINALKVIQKPEGQQELEALQNYLRANEAFNQGEYEKAIVALENIYQYNKSFASGTASQILYESYMARASQSISVSSFNSALSDYERAIIIAKETNKDPLIVFQAQIKLAYLHGILLNYEAGVLLYREAVDSVGMADQERYPEIAPSLIEAANVVELQNFSRAYVLYRTVFRTNEEYYDLEVYVVQPNDYLSSIARKMGSTVQMIVDANKLENPNKIFVGQKLYIPKLSAP